MNPPTLSPLDHSALPVEDLPPVLPGFFRADDGAVDRPLAVVVEQPVLPFGRFGLLLLSQPAPFAEKVVISLKAQE